jgi:hypothetical protein
MTSRRVRSTLRPAFRPRKSRAQVDWGCGYSQRYLQQILEENTLRVIGEVTRK